MVSFLFGIIRHDFSVVGEKSDLLGRKYRMVPVDFFVCHISPRKKKIKDL